MSTTRNNRNQPPPANDGNFTIDDEEEPTDTSYNQEAGAFQNEPGAAAEYDPYDPHGSPNNYANVQEGQQAPFVQPYDEHGQPYYPPDLYDEQGQPYMYDPNDPNKQQYDVNGQPYYPPQLYDEQGQPYDPFAAMQQPQQEYDENGRPIGPTDDKNADEGNYDDLPPVDDSDYQPKTQGTPEQAKPPPSQQPPKREPKYSTANMNEAGKCKKYLSICALILLFLAFMIGLSILFNHFFFSDESDNGPGLDQRDANGTFPSDKQDIDGACSRSNYRTEPQLCEDACAPQYFKCCDPFDEFDLYNYTKAPKNNSTNSTSDEDDDEDYYRPGRSSVPEINEKNYTFMEGYEDWEPADGSTCRFDTELRGCMSYAKCQVMTGQIDAAPGNLPDLCAMEQLDKDPEACKALCRPLNCCYSIESDNCLAEKFDLCMDYAPCQNLRALDGGEVLPTAPRTLDFDCFWQQPACTETCELAEDCGNPSSGVFQLNFMSCLTYAPCNNVTLTNIVVGEQFNTVQKPPKDIIYACNARDEPVLEPTELTCEEYCAEAACCWSSDPAINCFFEDPLGCMAWEAQCQVLLDG